MPTLPAARASNIRQRGNETPSHPGGLSEVARKKLEEHRRSREKQRGRYYFVQMTMHADTISEGIAAQHQRRDDAPRGLGDFQRRSNRDQAAYRRDHRDRHDRRGWDATPRSERGSREDAPSVRVPNVGWESTPRRLEDGPGWGPSRVRRWDAPTPRTSRRGTPGSDDEAPINLNVREWEEEQIRLDRDWYNDAEETGIAGDEDFNPLAQYEDLGAARQAELATRQMVCCMFHRPLFTR